jgi:hypothetical protein
VFCFGVAGISFTYKTPDSGEYLRNLISYLKYKKEEELVNLVSRAKCVISDTTRFSGKRWNAYWTAINFYVPLANLEKVTEEATARLLLMCRAVMPSDLGLDVMHVEFYPLFESGEPTESVVEHVEEAASGLSREVLTKILPADLTQKGSDMASIYLYLYCIENSLRLLIENVAGTKFGEKYLEKIALSSDVKRRVKDRKEDAAKKRWLPARGESDIFYLDFDHLGAIIRSNWKLFAGLFPDQNWIVAKIDELRDCRNLVAHNSYLEEHQRNIVKVYFTSILMQLGSTLQTDNLHRP